MKSLKASDLQGVTIVTIVSTVVEITEMYHSTSFTDSLGCCQPLRTIKSFIHLSVI